MNAPRFGLFASLVVALFAKTLHAEEVRSRSPGPASTVRRSTSRGWIVLESENFYICCRPSCKAAQTLPTACEALRAQLSETWFGTSTEKWTPVCHIVVHETTASYAAALGAGSEQSSGCATIGIDSGKVVGRRIDLRGDAGDWLDSALPHELTHVLLAERFTNHRIPRWADEGMAILVEPQDKQRRRREALERGLVARKGFSAAELTGLTDYPAADRRDAFYGESASLVAYLMERESPERLLDFLEMSAKRSPQAALQQVYGFADWQAVENSWKPRLMHRGASAEFLAQRVGRITDVALD
jgi:hypothetical protein